MKKKKIFVLGLGGSVIFPEKLDFLFLKKFSSFIKKEIKEDKKFIIVAGGGRLARQYQEALRKIGKFSSTDKDWLGIRATKLNSELLKTIFKDKSYPIIFDKRFKVKNFEKYSVILVSGWKPGYSTDFVALQIALDFNLKKAIFLGNIDYVYDKNPEIYKDAKPIKKLFWEDYFKLIPSKWKPGLRVPVDPKAARFAKKHNLEVIVAGAKNFSNLKKIFKNKKFKGSIITKSK